MIATLAWTVGVAFLLLVRNHQEMTEFVAPGRVLTGEKENAPARINHVEAKKGSSRGRK